VHNAAFELPDALWVSLSLSCKRKRSLCHASVFQENGRPRRILARASLHPSYSISSDGTLRRSPKKRKAAAHQEDFGSDTLSRTYTNIASGRRRRSWESEVAGHEPTETQQEPAFGASVGNSHGDTWVGDTPCQLHLVRRHWESRRWAMA
jgi:hypothetical protein